jgi:hypothetical protein
VGIQFNALEGAREFTDDDRRKVLKVLADVVHEIQDAHRLDGMFEPYAEIVHMVLTDDRIAQNFKDARAEEVRGRHAYGGPQGVSKPIAREEWGAARES